MDYLKDLPYSNEAEQAVIGSVLLEPDKLTDVLEIIKTEHFYVEKNKHIFAGMVELLSDNKPIDIVTLGNLLINKGIYESIGGNEYIKEIINNIPMTLNVKAYSEIIKEKAITRALIKASDEINKLCYEGNPVGTMLDLAVDKVFSVAKERENGAVSHIRPVAYENYNRLAELVRSGERFTGLPTGYQFLDGKIQGMQPGNLILIAARPGMGKSSFAANIAQNVAIRQNVPTALFTLEMSKEELANRIISSEAKISSAKIKSGSLSEDEIYKYIEALDPIVNSPLYIDDTASISITELRAKCKRLKLEKNLGLVIVDYLQLMSGTTKESRQQEISEISRGLKLIAKELGIPVIALSQMSRESEKRSDHKPVLSDLRESGAIEQDADIVLFLYHEGNYNKEARENEAECIIAKNRAGERGSVYFTWIGEYTTFYTKETTYEEPY